jgi:MFS family permease
MSGNAVFGASRRSPWAPLLGRTQAGAPHSPDPVVDRSLRHSIKDGVAYTVLSGGTETWFSAWALHLSATASQIGVLASLPPLLGSLSQLLGAWLGRRAGRRRSIILGGATVQALALLPMALLPLLFPGSAFLWVLMGATLYFGGVNAAAPQWSSLMGDLVPEDRRGRYFGLRNRLCSITGFTALALSGLLLDHFNRGHSTTTGFLLIFASGLAARALSIWHLGRMWDPPGPVAALQVPPLGQAWQTLSRSPFVRFSLFFSAMQFGVAIASPFFVVYMLKELGFSYRLFMGISASAVLVQFLTLNHWGAVSDALGNRRILKITGALLPVMPLLWLFSANPLYLVIIQAFSGTVWAGYSLSAGNFVYDLIPPDRRATLLAFHGVAGGLALFAGAPAGWLAGHPDALRVGQSVPGAVPFVRPGTPGCGGRPAAPPAGCTGQPGPGGHSPGVGA